MGAIVVMGKRTGLGTGVSIVLLVDEGRLTHGWGCPGKEYN